MILKSHSYLKNKRLNDILFSQFSATEKVFRQKKIPFILKRPIANTFEYWKLEDLEII